MEPKSSERHVPQNGFVEKKKKKCHGNRKLQRFRRTCRRKSMSTQANDMLMLIKNANDSLYKNVEKKDRPFLINPLSKLVDTMLSSIWKNETNTYLYSDTDFEANSKNESFVLSEPEVEPEWPTSISEKCRKKAKCYNLSNDHWKQLSKIKPNYKKLTSYQFKDVLIKTIPVHSHHHVKLWLTNTRMLNFLKHRAELIAIVFQLKIELDYWNYRVDLTNNPVVIWLSGIGKNGTAKNSINWDHTKTKANIKKQQKKIQKKLQKAEHGLNIHLRQPYPFECELTNENALFSFLNVISNGLITLTENTLSYFRTNFEQKKILLHFDINDGDLVKSLYNLNPTKVQIDIAQKIWGDQRKFYKKIIRQKKKTNSCSIWEEIACDDSFAPEQHPLLSHDFFSAPMYQIIQARLNNIKERTEQLLQFTHTIDDSIFF